MRLTVSRFIAATVRFAFVLVAALLPVSVVYARGGGGGGGHGGGGFGGGGHFGGYGGGYVGGFGGGYYGGYHPSYHGGGYYYHGGGYGNSGGEAVFLWIVVIVAAFFVLSRVFSAMAATRTLSVITLVLSNGAQYTSRFERFTRASRFDSPSERNNALHQLFDRIDEHDIVAAYIHGLDSGPDANRLGEEAKRIWQSEMDKAEVKADTINVSSPGNRIKASFAPEGAAEPGAIADGCCLLSVILVGSGIERGTITDRAAAIMALHRLHSSVVDSFYFYFTPSAGEAMPRYEAVEVLERIHGFA
jgi:hypothetical protein